MVFSGVTISSWKDMLIRETLNSKLGNSKQTQNTNDEIRN
jgi:hypothetical protein